MPPEHTHLLLDSKAAWIEVQAAGHDQLFQKYPKESLAQWHDRLGLTDGGSD